VAFVTGTGDTAVRSYVPVDCIDTAGQMVRVRWCKDNPAACAGATSWIELQRILSADDVLQIEAPSAGQEPMLGS